MHDLRSIRPSRPPQSLSGAYTAFTNIMARRLHQPDSFVTDNALSEKYLRRVCGVNFRLKRAGLLCSGDCDLRRESEGLEFLSRNCDEVSSFRKLSTRQQSFFHASDVGGVSLANKNLKPGVVRELKFDSMGAPTRAGLRRTYQIHLTNAGKNARHRLGPSKNSMS